MLWKRICSAFFILFSRYVEATVTDDMLNSKKPENLETCLKAGKIPTAYAGIVDSPQIGVRKSYECTASSNIKEMSGSPVKVCGLGIDLH